MKARRMPSTSPAWRIGRGCESVTGSERALRRVWVPLWTLVPLDAKWLAEVAYGFSMELVRAGFARGFVRAEPWSLSVVVSISQPLQGSSSSGFRGAEASLALPFLRLLKRTSTPIRMRYFQRLSMYACRFSGKGRYLIPLCKGYGPLDDTNHSIWGKKRNGIASQQPRIVLT